MLPANASLGRYRIAATSVAMLQRRMQTTVTLPKEAFTTLPGKDSGRIMAREYTKNIEKRLEALRVEASQGAGSRGPFPDPLSFGRWLVRRRQLLRQPLGYIVAGLADKWMGKPTMMENPVTAYQRRLYVRDLQHRRRTVENWIRDDRGMFLGVRRVRFWIRTVEEQFSAYMHDAWTVTGGMSLAQEAQLLALVHNIERESKDASRATEMRWWAQLDGFVSLTADSIKTVLPSRDASEWGDALSGPFTRAHFISPTSTVDPDHLPLLSEMGKESDPQRPREAEDPTWKQFLGWIGRGLFYDVRRDYARTALHYDPKKDHREFDGTIGVWTLYATFATAICVYYYWMKNVVLLPDKGWKVKRAE